MEIVKTYSGTIDQVYTIPDDRVEMAKNLFEQENWAELDKILLECDMVESSKINKLETITTWE